MLKGRENQQYCAEEEEFICCEGPRATSAAPVQEFEDWVTLQTCLPLGLKSLKFGDPEPISHGMFGKECGQK